MKIFDDLYYFYKIVRAGSLRKAAIVLDIEQGSLSYALTRLEGKMNSKLMIRKKTGIELTLDGKRLYNKVVDQYASLDQVVNDFGGTHLPQIQNELKIITTTGVVSLLIIPAIKNFLEDYPDVKIVVETIDGEVTFNETDADIGILPTVVDGNELSKKHICTVVSKMFCSQEYINKYGKPTSLDDLKNHRFISYYSSKTGYKGDVDWHLKYNNFSQSSLKINSAVSQFYAAKHGLGILAIPREFPNIHDSLIELFDDSISQSVEVFFITRRNYKNMLIDKFFQYVRNKFNIVVE